MATLTIGVDDYATTGPVPAVGAWFKFRRYRIDADTPRLGTVKPWVAQLDADGNGETVLPDSPPGNALVITSNVPGFFQVAVTGYPEQDMTLTDLLGYEVELSSLGINRTATAAWYLIVDQVTALVAQAAAQVAVALTHARAAATARDESRLAAVASASSASSSANAAALAVAPIAARVTAVESATSGQLTSQLASRLRYGDAVTVALAGDSTGDGSDEWWTRLWDAYWAEHPDTGLTVLSWSDATQSYTSTVRKAPKQRTVATRPVLDLFSQTAADLVGSEPIIGNPWTGAAGAFELADGAAVWKASPAGYVACPGKAPLVALERTVSGTVTIDTTNNGAGRSIDLGMYASNNRRISIRIAVLANGTAGWSVEGQFPTYARLAAGAAGALAAGAVQTIPFSLTVKGNAVTATLNGVTALATLDATRQAVTDSMNGLHIIPGGTATGWKILDMRLDAVVADGTSPVITAVNASKSGSTLDYQLTRLETMLGPAVGTLNALFISSSHNYYGPNEKDPAQYAAVLDSFVAAYRSRQPSSAIVVVAQNPQSPIKSTRATHRARSASLAGYAKRRGYGLIDALAAFEARADWASVLVSGDGVHPTTGNTAYDGTTEPNNGAWVWKEAALVWLRDLIKS